MVIGSILKNPLILEHAYKLIYVKFMKNSTQIAKNGHVVFDMWVKSLKQIFKDRDGKI